MTRRNDMLRVIQKSPDWITRKELAKALGIRCIAGVNADTLDALRLDRLIEGRKVYNADGHTVWQYRRIER